MRVVNAIGNTVLLKEANVEQRTSSGIVLNKTGTSPIYEIVSMGDLAKNENLFNIGDKVVIKHTVGTNVPIDSTTIYKSVKWWEIDGVVDR